MLVGLACSLAGGFVAGMIARRRTALHGVFASVTAGGAAFLLNCGDPVPQPYWTLGLLGSPPVGALDALLARRG